MEPIVTLKLDERLMTVDTETPVTERVLLHGVSWATYEALLAEVENRGIRLTYDRGELEIMTPSNPHERYKSLIGRLIEAMTEELAIPIRSGGSTTFRSKLLEKGLEPDECYWVENEARMRMIRELDLTKDPPPDLAIEVEVSRSALDRLGIYASLGVPEAWRWTRGSRLVCHVRGDDGQYHEVSRSGRFPFLAPGDLGRFLAQAGNTDETTWIRGFRKWVHDEFGGEAGTPGVT
jgi:Uma2 family endonuclease